ncbi:MAG: hypothetical protein VKK59_01335 [Vampirovibrionales bacterium]|nr:hypothetical protein [Vampirovibrionales bacterium]
MRIQSPTFGYAGNFSANSAEVYRAAQLVKSDPTPVGVAASCFLTPYGLQPFFQVVTAANYGQALQAGRLIASA